MRKQRHWEIKLLKEHLGWLSEEETEEAATTEVWRARSSPQEGLVGAQEGVKVRPRGKALGRGSCRGSEPWAATDWAVSYIIKTVRC